MFALDHFLIVCIHRVLAECQAGIGKKTDKKTKNRTKKPKCLSLTEVFLVKDAYYFNV